MATPIDLGYCNRSSAKVACFLVKATMGKTSKYSYKERKCGGDVTVHVFETRLDGENPNSYCMGFSFKAL